jgi:hypothetical protein
MKHKRPCNAVDEYFFWLVQKQRIRWFQQQDSEFHAQKGTAGTLPSKLFHGLISDVKALLKHAMAKVIQSLKSGKKRRS